MLDLFVLPIEGPNVVLGIQWLQRLGRVSHDYSALSMEFSWEDKLVTLRGEVTPTTCLITLHQFQESMHTAVIQSLFEIHTLTTDNSSTRVTVVEVPPLEFPSSLPVAITFLLHRYHTLFHPPTRLPPHCLIDHKLHLFLNTNPINVHPYRYPYFQKIEMEKLIQEMLEQGIIRPSTSPLSSPVLLVQKKDGTYRFCVDYRALNAAIVTDKFPIPTINELLNELGGATVLTKLDLQAGYHQIWMHTHDTYKTAFQSHEGHYEFLVMPFGLINAPSTFQAAMNHIVAAFLRKFVIVLFDDILIYSASLEDHAIHLEQILACLHSH